MEEQGNTLKVSRALISSNANSNRHSIDVSKEGIIAISTSNCIMIGDGVNVDFTLSHHKSRINSLQWFHHSEYDYSLISCGDDSLIVIWTCMGDWKDYRNWTFHEYLNH